MKYRKLGKTQHEVSVICLGTMTWGEQNTEREAHEQLDYAFERGVNFIDTAEMYPVPPKAETYTLTEKYIGTWDKLKTHRDKIFLASKIAGPMEAGYIRGGNNFSKDQIKKACEDSLKRLQVEIIDLYQLHWPERTTNYFGQLGIESLPPTSEESFTPFIERLEALDELRKEGKIKEFGLSNETPWGVMKYLQISEREGLIRPQSIQNPYNLLNRSFEVGNAEISLRENIGLLAYSPLGFGVLTGKYLKGAKPENARLTKWERFSRYSNPEAQRATELYCELAQDHGLSPAQMALAFVNQRSFLTSNIIGATQMDQLKENIESIEIELSQKIRDEINKIHSKISNPAP